MNLFDAESDYLLFLELFKKYLAPYFDTYAYCLMPNHYHFLVRIKAQKEVISIIKKETTRAAEKLITGEYKLDDFLSDQMPRMFSSSSLRINNKYKRKGALFTPKVKRISVDNLDRVRYLICYLHHNPIHHGYKSNYWDWKFSSYRALSTVKTTMLDRKNVLQLFETNDGFDEMHHRFKIGKSEDLIDQNYF